MTMLKDANNLDRPAYGYDFRRLDWNGPDSRPDRYCFAWNEL